MLIVGCPIKLHPHRNITAAAIPGITSAQLQSVSPKILLLGFNCTQVNAMTTSQLNTLNSYAQVQLQNLTQMCGINFQPSNDQSSNQLSPQTIIGISVSVTMIVMILTCVSYFFWRHKKFTFSTDDAEPHSENSGDEGTHTAYRHFSDNDLWRSWSSLFVYESWLDFYAFCCCRHRCCIFMLL